MYALFLYLCLFLVFISRKFSASSSSSDLFRFSSFNLIYISTFCLWTKHFRFEIAFRLSIGVCLCVNLSDIENKIPKDASKKRFTNKKFTRKSIKVFYWILSPINKRIHTFKWVQYAFYYALHTISRSHILGSCCIMQCVNIKFRIMGAIFFYNCDFPFRTDFCWNYVSA